MNEKRYLGDGVYAEYNGFHIVLIIEDEEGFRREICLEDSIFYALLDFAKKIGWMVGNG